VKTVARELLRDRARALPDVASREIFQGRTGDPEQIVAAVLVNFASSTATTALTSRVATVVRHRLPVLDVDLAGDFAVRSRITLADSICSSLLRSKVAAWPFEMRSQGSKVNPKPLTSRAEWPAGRRIAAWRTTAAETVTRRQA